MNFLLLDYINSNIYYHYLLFFRSIFLTVVGILALLTIVMHKLLSSNTTPPELNLSGEKPPSLRGLENPPKQQLPSLQESYTIHKNHPIASNHHDRQEHHEHPWHKETLRHENKPITDKEEIKMSESSGKSEFSDPVENHETHENHENQEQISISKTTSNENHENHEINNNNINIVEKETHSEVETTLPDEIDPIPISFVETVTIPPKLDIPSITKNDPPLESHEKQFENHQENQQEIIQIITPSLKPSNNLPQEIPQSISIEKEPSVETISSETIENPLFVGDKFKNDLENVVNNVNETPPIERISEPIVIEVKNSEKSQPTNVIEDVSSNSEIVIIDNSKIIKLDVEKPQENEQQHQQQQQEEIIPLTTLTPTTTTTTKITSQIEVKNIEKTSEVKLKIESPLNENVKSFQNPISGLNSGLN